jgi:signal transduction histidine kinase
MSKKLFPSLQQSIDRIKNNPQLWYTLFVAVMIVLAFVFVANRFVTIAQDAQDRLVNVRIGALQSSFVEFVDDYFETETDIEELQSKIQKIAVGNSTINTFRVVQFEGDRARIIASLNSSEVGKFDSDNSFIYGIAEIDKNSSHTLEQIVNNERVFTTVRVIKDDSENVIGAVLTTQSLSQADIAIANSIQNSVLIFIVIVVLIMFLFFRHSRIIDYSSLYKKMKEIDELKDDFISMASHELRTPLTIIRGYAEDLSDQITKLSDQQQKSLERINIATSQLDNLVNDMLDVSRIEQGRMQFDLKVISVVENLKDIVLGFEKPAEDKGLHLLFNNINHTEPKINVDPDKFRQVMVNIIGNSIKYTKEGEINVNLSTEKDKIVIRVSDSGIGMSEEERKNLFQKFYRVKNDETHEIRGTGLGLWITKQIVENMGGKISVESIKGVGTHFIVTFPQVK